MRRVVAKRLARQAHEEATGFNWHGSKLKNTPMLMSSGQKHFPYGTVRRTYQDMKREYLRASKGTARAKSARIIRKRERAYYTLPGKGPAPKRRV
jgi:hypothetical protein